jgi:hypothetical protein
MSTILIGKCEEGNLYHLWDADAAREPEFEYKVAKALMCVYPDYKCIVFNGGFRFYDAVSRPDLALIAKDYSHWFIIEVELISHSLNRHVLPQIRAFQYGTPEPDCITVLARETGLPEAQVRTFLNVVPRGVPSSQTSEAATGKSPSSPIKSNILRSQLTNHPMAWRPSRSTAGLRCRRNTSAMEPSIPPTARYAFRRPLTCQTVRS